MNGIEPLLVALIVFAVRDGILAWWLIHKLIAAVPPAAPAPAPIPEPHPAPVAAEPEPVVPAAGKPRFTNIVATSFAGGNDSAVSRTSAYDGKIIDGDRELAAALPAHGMAGRLIRVFYKGRTVDTHVRDVGPWNGDPISTDDPYWTTGSRPQAETGTDKTGRKTNRAGIDLSPAAWKALGYVGNPRQAEEKVDWDFVDRFPVSPAVLPGPAAAEGTIPAPLVLMRKLRDMGVHAEHDSAIILSWPVAIANKFPEMADYTKGYQHDSTPWCGLTMAYVMAMSGIRPQFGAGDTDKFLWADSWRQFGTVVETPQPGDIMVFKWAGGGHHVTMYDHEVDDNFYHCTGGNQGSGHVLSTEAMPMQNCVAIRRPA
jgi:uncharacterized protein (TIGR02594 family)